MRANYRDRRKVNVKLQKHWHSKHCCLLRRDAVYSDKIDRLSENLAAFVCRVGGTAAGGNGTVDTGRRKFFGRSSKEV